ncbi:plasma kallikrein-like [Thrips palmi]|uniref:Plasma kallikrein-like n=1 Tax=Thrips palmi TaxID=161013 RepID=A0A6P8Y361_THRPL|nr:plasma kallikrein-like [Thrips palmi]
MQALAAFVLASALLGAIGPALVCGAGVRETGPGHLTSIVEIIESFPLGIEPTHRASGVLITPKYVLSTKEAAGKPGITKRRHVVVGRSAGGEGVAVEIDYKASPEHPDGLILLKLQEDVNLDAVTKAANLPHGNTDNTGASALLASWGSTKDKLQSSTVNVLTKAECVKKGVKEGLLCSADKGKGACGGDEGSPIVQDLKNGVYKLVGIVTGAQDVKTCLETTAYFDVAKYSSWILDKVYG